MDIIVAAGMAAAFGGGAVLIWKAGPFLENASRRMGGKRKMKTRHPRIDFIPGEVEPAKKVELPEEP